MSATLAIFSHFLINVLGPSHVLAVDLASAPYVNVDVSLGFTPLEVPNDTSGFPAPPGSNGPLKKLIMMSWSLNVETSDSENNVEIEKISLIAKGKKGGSKELVFKVYSLGEYMPNFERSGDIPLRCFASEYDSVSLTAQVWIRQVNESGSIDRERHPRTAEVTKLPPYLQQADRHTGSLSTLCNRN